MEQVGVRELEQNASAVLARVRAGETVEITERGVPVALLTPRADQRSLRERLLAEGKLMPRTGGDLLDVVPVNLGPDDPASSALVELRDAERF